MPWQDIKLNDGTSIPSIAFGTWKLGNGQLTVDRVDQALAVGFDHIDTAQVYRNEIEAGQALKESGLGRSDVYITTKWSGLNGLDIQTSIQNSLQNLGVSYVDLYLIHAPSLAVPDIATVWSQMEQVKSDGLAKSIGVSNFGVQHLETLLQNAKVVPAVNQILYHPYVHAQHQPILDFAAKHGIIIEAYSPLIPVTQRPGGPLDKPMSSIATRLGATNDQVLMAWAKAKGTVVVTSSTKKTRLQGYLAAGDLDLTEADIKALDDAGDLGARRFYAKTIIRRGIVAALVAAAVLGASSYVGII